MRNTLPQIGKWEKRESSLGRHPERMAKDLCPGGADRVQPDLGHHIFPSGREPIFDWQWAKKDLQKPHE